MQGFAARLRDLPPSVFAEPEPGDAWDASPMSALSDHALLQAVAAAIERPKVRPETSFVIHAPLELIARARLLAHAPPAARPMARRRIAQIATLYAAAGPETDPQNGEYPDADAARAALLAAVEAADTESADAAAGFLAQRVPSGALVAQVADAVIPRLGLAAHAPILLAGALTSAEGRSALPRLLRAPLRSLALDGGSRLTWQVEADRPAGGKDLFEILRDPPRVKSPSTSIKPTMLAVEADGLAERLLGRATAEMSLPQAEQALLRIAAWSMLEDDPAHAPYGWSHALTLPQAALTVARVAKNQRAAIRVAATHVLAFRATLGSGPLKMRPPPSGPSPATGSPAEAAAAAWRDGDRIATMSRLAARASTHHDAHLAKYTLACFDAAESDPDAAPLFLAAAAYLGAWWDANPDAGLGG